MNETRLPRLLLVEDDPVSASYLHDAASALRALVDVAATIADALAMAKRHPHDLYLIDANLPDGRGEVLLQSLRDIGIGTPALAHTAAHDPGMRERMLALGFVGVLHQPLGMAELLEALREHLPGSAVPAPVTRLQAQAAARWQRQRVRSGATWRQHTEPEPATHE